MADRFGEAELELSTDQGPLDAGLDQAERKTRSFVQRVGDGFRKDLSRSIGQGIGQSIGQLGAGLIRDAFGQVVDGFQAMIGSALSFEQGMRNVNSIAKVTDAELSAMGKTALEIGGEFGQSAQTMTDALYDITSSGFEGSEALDVLRASALAATAGMSTTGEAAAGITAVLNAYGLGAEEAAHVSDVLFKTVERGVVTFPELASEIGKTTALAAPLGVSLEEVGAALAIMTRAGIDAENATTQLNAIMASMLKPSAEASKLAAQLGLDWSAAGLRANGLAGQLSLMIQKTNGSEEAMATLLGDARAIRGAFSLAANSGADLTAELEELRAAGGAAGDAFGEQSKGAAFKLAQAQAKLEAAGIAIGEKLLPVLADLATFISEDVAPAIQGLADLIGLLGGEVPETTDALGSLADMLLNLVPGHLAFGATLDDVEEKMERSGRTWRKAAVDGRLAGEDIAHSARHNLSAAAGAFEDFGDAASYASRKVRTTASDILQTFITLREGIVGDAQAAAAALYDPIIAQLELVETEEELRAVRKKLRDAGITETERIELEKQRANLGKDLIEKNALILTYGTEAEQLSKINAFLSSSWWPQAYKDADPELVAALDVFRLHLQQRVDGMTEDSKTGGRRAGQGYADNLRGQAGNVQGAAATMSSAANSAFSAAQAQARRWGYSTGAAYAAGLRASYGLVSDGVQTVLSALTDGMRASSPPGPKSPLHHIGDWGYRTFAEWIKRGAEALTIGRAELVAGLGGVASAFTSARLGGSFALATAAGGPSTFAEGAAGARGRGGNTYHYHIHGEGQLKIPDPLHAANTLARFQSAGMLPEADEDA